MAKWASFVPMGALIALMLYLTGRFLYETYQNLRKKR